MSGRPIQCQTIRCWRIANVHRGDGHWCADHAPAATPTGTAPESYEVPVLDRWGRQVLTVGQLRAILAELDDSVQVVIDDRDGWYANVSFIGVPFDGDDALDCSPYSALTLAAGDPFDARQL